MVNRIGQQFGNYRLVRFLGQGGFAEVYLGEHIHMGTQAAIKVLHTQFIATDFQSFLQEARTLATLDHPHIVRVLDCGIQNGSPFLVMNYAPYGTLRQRYAKGTTVPLETVILYLSQIAPALQYAHDRRLIHRDMKPENMLIGQDGRVLVSDFGIAVVSSTSTSQHTKTSAGTVTYMAPEQMMAKPQPASDQYSLGIVVFEWLCGNTPFNGSFAELTAQHLHMPPPSLRAKDPRIPPAVEGIVLRALAKEPQQRFASVQAFATALSKYQQAQPPFTGQVQSFIISPPDQSSRFTRTLGPTNPLPPGTSSMQPSPIAPQLSGQNPQQPAIIPQRAMRLPAPPMPVVGQSPRSSSSFPQQPLYSGMPPASPPLRSTVPIPMQPSPPQRKSNAFGIVLTLVALLLIVGSAGAYIYYLSVPKYPSPPTFQPDLPITPPASIPPSPTFDPTPAPLTLSLGAVSIRLLGQGYSPDYEIKVDVTNDGSQVAKDFDIVATIQTQDPQNPTIVFSVISKGYLSAGQHFTYTEPFSTATNSTQYPLPSPQNVEIKVYLGDQVINDEFKPVSISS